MGFTARSGSGKTDLDKKLSPSDHLAQPDHDERFRLVRDDRSRPAGTGDPARDRADDRAGDQAGDPARDQADDRAGDQAGDQADDQAGDQAGDPARDQAGDPARDQADDRAGDQAGTGFGLSPVQVGASALAAVTAALVASFLGVAGTIMGAAFGSVVSTIAAAFYTRSLTSAGVGLRRSGELIIQRMPPGSGRRLTAVPRAALRQQADRETGFADGSVAQQAPIGSTGPGGRVVAGRDGHDAHGWGGRGGRRRPVLLVGIGVTGFLLAMAGITAAETFLGHPVSGGVSGTSVGSLIGADSPPMRRDAPGSTVTPGTTWTGGTTGTPGTTWTGSTTGTSGTTGTPSDSAAASISSSVEITGSPSTTPGGVASDLPASGPASDTAVPQPGGTGGVDAGPTGSDPANTGGTAVPPTAVPPTAGPTP